ncbi:TIGR01777 family oxidoreductase [Candidatus Binatia bacterium]|nr:TIGR01777 family oxidoreductase [Candidatus Binatia bacterium]
MSSDVFIRRSRMAAPARAVFAWHARPGALERLTPPWTALEVVDRQGGIENGARVVLRIPVGPTSVKWVAEHCDYVEGRQFRDVQIEGPFARWEHTHRFDPEGRNASTLEDRIVFALPFGAVGATVGKAVVQRLLDRTFEYRHRLTAGDLDTHARHDGPPLHVAVTGASGLIGSALVPFLTTGGHAVTRLVRGARQAAGDNARWDPATGAVDVSGRPPLDAVVHLAGENIAGRRWTADVKARVRSSRGNTTRLLCEALARLDRPPRVLVCASAIGFYGDRAADPVDENSAAGDGFLPEVCREWEAATLPAAERGIRVINLRLGVVLTARGGALGKLLLPFQLGVGGRVGDGSQLMSWIGLDDVLGCILHALRTEGLHGPVNAVAPAAATNAEFTRALGRVLGRPTAFPVPAVVARLAFGEMADEMLLASTRVVPARLQASGFVWRHAQLIDALRHTLGRR